MPTKNKTNLSVFDFFVTIATVILSLLFIVLIISFFGLLHDDAKSYSSKIDTLYWNADRKEYSRLADSAAYSREYDSHHGEKDWDALFAIGDYYRHSVVATCTSNPEKKVELEALIESDREKASEYPTALKDIDDILAPYKK